VLVEAYQLCIFYQFNEDKAEFNNKSKLKLLF
jgi:hypothetical protein